MAGDQNYHGGPAFPKPLDPYPNLQSIRNLSDAPSGGMSLRDWFAGQALAGDLAATPNCRPSIAGSAERAYAYADAMLAERQKP